MKRTEANIDTVEVDFMTQHYIIFRINRKNDPIPMERAERVLRKSENISAHTHEITLVAYFPVSTNL